MALTGYQHPAYARSLAEFGEPLELEGSGGWLLRRAVPNSTDFDAMGCYPLFSALDWARLSDDLASLSERLVSVVLVTDPFGKFSVEQLRRCFDRVSAFKEHFVADFSEPLTISKHHAYYARKAAAACSIEVGPPPPGFCEEWMKLYETLVRRKGLTGIKAFSRKAFEEQLSVPGITAVRAVEKGVLVGAHLWYEQEDGAYSHLAAASDRGYKIGCSYSIYAATLEYFRSRVRYVDFGAGAGAAIQDDGLSYFKKAWSNCRRPAYLCGKVLNAPRYDALSRTLNANGSDYFPAYRAGELT